MPTTTIVSPTAVLFDEARLAVAGFLARYSGPTRTSYATDLRQFFSWCAQMDLEVFAVKRGHVELWARAMEDRGLARATIGRRLSTVAGFYRIAVLDGLPRTPRRSTSGVRRSTPSPPRWVSIAWSSVPSWPRGRRGARSTTPLPVCSVC